MIKYRRVTDAIPELCRLVISTMQDRRQSALSNFLNTKPVLVPIPLHARRKKERWFNQSELMVEHLALELHLRVESAFLIRRTFTQSQAGLPKYERQRNIKSAFETIQARIKEEAISNIILFDDVWTTGSTMREAGNVLKRSGVKNVWALTVAR